jgi:hypothetical protein
MTKSTGVRANIGLIGRRDDSGFEFAGLAADTPLTCLFFPT